MVQSNFVSKIKEEFTFWRVGIVPGFLIIAIAIALRLTGSMQSLEWLFFDKFLRLRPPESLDERITIVGINEEDIKNVGTYPIPDRNIAKLLKKLQSYQPIIIGLDIFRDLPVPPGNHELLAAFKDTNNLVAIEKVLPERVTPPPTLPPEKLGFADAVLDADGRLRRSLLSTSTDKGYKLSLTIKLAEAYLKAKSLSLENGIYDRQTMRFGATEIPRFQPNYGGYVGTNVRGTEVILNYRSGRKPFRIISLTDVEKGKVNPDWLRDRIVIIGVTSPSVKDVISTSVTSSDNLAPGLVYGVEIQAHAVSQIISAVIDVRPLLRAWSDGWEYLWIVTWGILGIVFARITKFPLRNILAVVITSLGLIAFSYWLLICGWWIPIVPTFLVFVINGVSLTALYQYDLALRSRISDRQFIIDKTFDTIHNGPLQIIAKLLRTVREEDLPRNELVSELEHLNRELRAIYEFMQREPLTQDSSLHLNSSLQLNLQIPLHELLYQVYSYTLERDLPCFKTLKVKIRTFDSIDDGNLDREQKAGICRFLEEALCNVGKHAQGVTRLVVIYTQKDGWYVLRITDNGEASSQLNSQGRGTQQSRNITRQLRGKFERSALSPKGTVCELTWPVKKRFWFW